jgi:translocation and assembly module TamB
MNDNVTDPQSDRPPPPRRRGQFIWKIVGWTLGSVATLIVISVVAIVILLHNERFHNYILATVQKQASESLGVRVRLQNFALNLSHLDLDLYGLTVDGAAPYANPPVLQVDHAEISVRIVSIVNAKWCLDSFRVDRPVVRVFVDANGVSNLPTIKSRGDSGNGTSIFDLAIRRAVLDQGEIYYNDKQTPLAADLHDVEFQASFHSLFTKYSGSLSYTDGHLASGTLKTIPHNLQAEFDATPTTFHLTKAKLSTGPSQVLLIATLQNYSHPNVDAHYDAIVDGGQVGQVLHSPSIPTGLLRATGDLHFQQMLNRSLLDSLVVNGDLNSGQMDLKTPSLRTQITNLAGHYSLANGDAKLKDFRLNLLGGTLTGAGTMSNVAGDSHSKVSATLRGASLAELKHLAGTSASTGSVALTGGLDVELEASWSKSLKDLVAHADAAIIGAVHGQAQSRAQSAGGATVVKTSGAPANATGIPIEGAIHGVYTASNLQVALSKSYVRTPQTNLTMNGIVSDRSSLDLQLQANDLGEIETVADLFRTPTPGQQLEPLGLAGTASFRGTIRGSVAAPHLTGQFIASNLHVNGSEWKLLRSNVELSSSFASLQQGELEHASGGHIAFNASTALTKWLFTNSSPLQVDLDATQLNVADLAKLTGQALAVTGTLAANVKLHGTVLDPVGNGTASVSKMVAYDQPVSLAKITFTGTGDEAHADLAIQLPSGNIQGNVSVRPKDKTFVAKLGAAGISLDKLQALKARNIDAGGELSLNANGEGTFGNPQLDATLQIPRLEIQKQAITGLNLHVTVADHVANATLATSAVNTNIQAKARISLTGDYLSDVTLDTQAIPLQPLLAIYAPEQAANLSGETEVHVTLHGPLKNKSLIEAHVTVPTLKIAYGKSVQLAAASPIHLDYKNGIVDVQRGSIQGTDTDIHFQGSIPVVGNAPMSLMLLGTVNLQLAQLFDPEVRTSGELKIDINSNRTSDFGGKIDIVNASYASADLPVGLRNGNGTLTLTRDRLSITKFQGTVGGGTLNAQGGVSLRPSIEFDLGLSANGIRMLYPQGMREGIDANLRLAGSTDTAVLGGSINLTDLSFTSAFDLNSFISQLSGGVSSPPTPGLSQNLQLNLAVRSSSDINLVSRTLSIDGSAKLQVRGTVAKPVILGRVNINSGDVILNGDRFVLNGGTVEFVNPSETEPVLNLSLKTTIQQYDVYLRFIGPINQLRTNYNSDPALPSADIINLLAFGRTTEANAANPSTPANQAAAGLVASQVSSQVTSRVSKIAGISQLSINPVLAGSTSQGPPGANITVQQRVTGNLFVTFSSNVASTQSQTIQGQYQLSPRVALSATRDQNGGFAFDAIIKKTW